jgi:hypothetical protein
MFLPSQQDRKKSLATASSSQQFQPALEKNLNSKINIKQVNMI